ncbi:MAG: alpha/beta hydrolase [Anderseniella sp.]
MLYATQTGVADEQPIVFVHAGGFSGTMWREIAALLPDKNCVLPDLPGHGNSRNVPFDSIEGCADELAGFIKQQTFTGPVDLVGLSFGSYVGLLLMARHPHLVRSAMLSGFHVCGMPNPRLMKLMGYITAPLMQLRWMRRKNAQAMGLKDDSLTSDEQGNPLADVATVRRLLNEAVDFDAREILSAIDIPTLAIAGGKEHKTILKSLSLLQDRMPDCIARIVPGSGHAWCAEHPDLFAATVRSWVSSQAVPDRLEAVKP